LLPDANIYLPVDFNNPSKGIIYYGHRWTTHTSQGTCKISIYYTMYLFILYIYYTYMAKAGGSLEFDLIWFSLIMFVIVNVYFSVFLWSKVKVFQFICQAWIGMEDRLRIEFVAGMFKKHLAEITILLTDFRISVEFIWNVVFHRWLKHSLSE
jgi:hypothetical protein